ncbi:MAG: HD domain-containing protein [Gemmatimonadota bacterium]
MSLHPILAEAASGGLPQWSCAGESRREHIRRVADLMEAWAEALGHPPEEVARWRAAGRLHDALRDADPADLVDRVDPALADLPGGMLHGPAAAERLKAEGVRDEAFLRAVAFHTIGHPAFDELGRFLYAADFLEPGRRFLPEWRAELRGRMVREPGAVMREVARARIRNLLERFRPIRPETREFWNILAQEMKISRTTPALDTDG